MGLEDWDWEWGTGSSGAEPEPLPLGTEPGIHWEALPVPGLALGPLIESEPVRTPRWDWEQNGARIGTGD